MRGRFIAFVAVVTTGLVPSACADAPRAGEPNAADSAGVVIVTNPTGSLESAAVWSLSPEPITEIGAGAEPAVGLYRVTAVTPLEGGRIAVGMDSPPHVQLFTADGAAGPTLGRPGEGPGEFSTVTSVVPLGDDSIAVWDQNRRQISIFAREGRFVRTVNLSTLVPWSPIAAANTREVAAFTHLHPWAADELVLFAVGAFGPGVGLRRVEAASHRITAGGEELARFGPFPGMETFDLGPGQGGTVPFPFAAGTYGATAGDALVVGTAETPEYRVYDSTGALQRIVRWPDQDRSVRGPLLADWMDFVNGWLGEMPTNESSAVRAMLEAVPQREQFPAYDGLLTSDEGEVWIGGYAGQHASLFPPRSDPVPARRWLVFGPDGSLRAAVETPEGFQPHTVRDGVIWGVLQGELDVESVRAYAVLKAQER